ncbi:hypothetical protein O9H85_08180 [Paenibacillus filicis]|uniref:Phage major capsid protein n=1 Tax=Paenibacillus gyeongsangnamensis TaxID=3388067 RepID=A0ABT4Q6S6_9BACL|nr:hypothetical protein [Paenibacillus filicis]MCZ8512410.1 hypothetical protein [Paenibacillus filicis]
MSNHITQPTFTSLSNPELASIRAGKAVTLQKFVELKAAATDYQNFGVLLTPQFKREINDIKRERGVFGQLLDKYQTRATGQPHRWYDQYVLPNTGGFVDPRNIQAVTAANNGSSLRTEFYAQVRALAGQINFGLFDQQVNEQSGIFPDLVAKDLKDMLTAVYQAEDLGLFTGTATGLTDTTSVQYASIKTQAQLTLQVNPGVSIIDSIRTKVANMMANQTVVVKPTHVFVNPLLLDIMEQEIKNAANTYKEVLAKDVEVLPGIAFDGIRTAAGTLPVIPCWEMSTKTSTVTGASTDYPIFVASMNQIEKGWVGSPDIQLYKMGLSTDLADKYVAVTFNTGAILKAPAYAHAWGYVSR